MSLDINYGTQYYAISCGVPSASGVNVSLNYSSNYYWLSANDFILWGQPNFYTGVAANSGNYYYFYQCGVSSTPGIDLNSNAGTVYWYNSAFNCVSFCP